MYREFKREETPDAMPGFCRVATIEEIRDDATHCRQGDTSGRQTQTRRVPFEELADLSSTTSRTDLEGDMSIEAQVLTVLSSIERSSSDGDRDVSGIDASGDLEIGDGYRAKHSELGWRGPDFPSCRPSHGHGLRL